MKNNFKADNRRWDQYRVFYTEHNGFVSFETGETMYTWGQPNPEYRHFYPEFNTTIFGTSDKTSLKFIHPHTGNIIPRAQLSHKGIQYLLVDHTTKRVVKLDRWREGKNVIAPHLSTATAFASVDGANPVGGKIIVNAPAIITPEAVEWKKVVETIIKLKEVPELRYRYSNASSEVGLEQIEKTPYDFVNELHKSNDQNYHEIKKHGLVFSRASVPLDYILIE